jgi:hypothetical protein
MEMIRATTNGKPSSNVHSFGYDPETSTLAVRFLDKQASGDLYHIRPKTPGDSSLAYHFGQMSRPQVSVGGYYHRYIKGKYHITKQ